MDAYSLIFLIMKNTQKDKKPLPACRERTLMSAALFTYLPPLFTYLCAMSAKGCLPQKPRYIINTPKMTVHDNQSIWCLKMFVIWREITASHWRCVYESRCWLIFHALKLRAGGLITELLRWLHLLNWKGRFCRAKYDLKKNKKTNNFDGDNLAALQNWQFYIKLAKRAFRDTV